jgi:hypothetical protein
MGVSRKEFGTYCKEVFPDYFWDVVRYWYLVGLTGFIGIFGALVDMGDFDFPAWIWWLIGLSGLFVAQFLAWNSVRKERDLLRRYDVAQGTLKKLSEFRGKLIDMQNDPVATEEALGAWKERYSNLRREILDSITAEVSPAEADLFETLGNYAPIAITGKHYVNDSHFDFTSRIIRDHNWLAKAVEDYGRQRFRPQLFSNENENAK